MSTNITLTPVTLPDGTCFPGKMQELLALIAGNIKAALADSVTLFNFGPNTPPVDRQDQPWVRTAGTGLLLGIYTFTGGAWEPQDLPFTTGDIMAFSGAPGLIVPPWYLADGRTIQTIQNNVIVNAIVLPDLRGRFLVASGQRTLPAGSVDSNTNFVAGATGGAEMVAFTSPSQLYPHAHPSNASPKASGGVNAGFGSGPAYFAVSGITDGYSTGLATGNANPDGTANTTAAAQSTPHPNLPPYFALAYKMYISREDAGLT